MTISLNSINVQNFVTAFSVSNNSGDIDNANVTVYDDQGNLSTTSTLLNGFGTTVVFTDIPSKTDPSMRGIQWNVNIYNSDNTVKLLPDTPFYIDNNGVTYEGVLPMATGTDEGFRFTASQSYRTAGDEVKTLRGNGGSETEAINELSAKKGILHESNTLIGEVTVNRLLTTLEQTAYDGVAQATGENAAAVVIRLQKSLGNNRVRNVSVRISNAGTSIKGSAIANDVNGSDPAVQAFVTAYRDGDNNGGYVFLNGYFD